MINPVSIFYSGDESSARMLDKLALAEMEKTESLMVFQGIDQLKRVVDVAPGIRILTHKFFGIRKVEIFVQPKKTVGGDVNSICLCNCNFAFGVIIEEQDDKLEKDGSALYTAIVCRNKQGYVIENDIIATDFSEYLPGQKVILISYNEAMFRCCENIHTSTGCSPLKSEFDVSNDNWRTTMRILPWRAFQLRKWYNVNG